jgi:hypothetical protein
MGNKDMVDHGHFGQTKLGQSGACIDQYILIEQKGCRAEITAYPPATTKHS